MRDSLFRAGLTAALVFITFALGVFVLAEIALPRERGSLHAKTSAAPRPCARPLAMIETDPGWRVFHGASARKYIDAAFAAPPRVVAEVANADVVAYTRAGEAVGLVVARDGCIILRRVVPLAIHRKVMDKAFGWIA